jgi:hypothetical protein
VPHAVNLKPRPSGRPGPSLWPTGIGYGDREEGRTPTHDMQQQGMRNMHHFYPRGAFYLACMAAGVVLMLLFYFWGEQIWALWVWLWT